jgi:uncharacterized membrane protein YkoI
MISIKTTMNRFITLLALLLSLTLALPGVAAEAPTVSKQDAAVAAMQRIPGKVISVSPEQQQHTPVYRVKVLDEHGGLHTVIIHGQTGDVISAH